MEVLRVIDYGHPNIHFNLAFEQTLIKRARRERNPILKFWKVNNAVIIGRTQDVELEINLDYCEGQNISIARRISSGGTVFVDNGNLNVATIFPIKKVGSDISSAISKLVFILKSCLKTLGYKNIKIINTSSLTYNGKKISGSAQYHYAGWLLHHFTVTFNISLEFMERALKAFKSNYRGTSKFSLTGNLDKFNSDKFKKIFILYFSKLTGCSSSEYFPVESELAGIEKLAKSVYQTKHWIFGKKI